MRRLIGASALALAALLTGTCVVAGAAQAVPAAAPADDVFYPEGQAPVATKPAPKPAATTPAPAEAVAPAASGSEDREAALARGSREAADLMGYLPSLYTGKWYMPARESVRRCIMDRESNFNYQATSGTYHGAYQMSSALAEGATWMMQKEVRKEMGDEGVAIVAALRQISPNKWNRYWQDRAFWTIWRNGAGAGHWGGGAFGC
jgi:hypothetical protein